MFGGPLLFNERPDIVFHTADVCRDVCKLAVLTDLKLRREIAVRNLLDGAADGLNITGCPPLKKQQDHREDQDAEEDKKENADSRTKREALHGE